MKNLRKKIIAVILLAGIFLISLPPAPISRALTNEEIQDELERQDAADRSEFLQRAPTLLSPAEIDDRDRGDAIRAGQTSSNQSSATDGNKKLDAIRASLDNVVCGIFSGNFILSGECIAKGLAYLSFYWLNIMGVFLSVAGFTFNAALGITIDNTYYNAESVPALRIGWNFSRDIVNLFFIFILLFIAIATILQVESYGAKELLARLIIIALLVNFSFLAAQAIIFMSNALAVTIYNAQANIVNTPSSAASYFELKFNKDFAGNIVGAFSPQRLFLNLPVEHIQISQATGGAKPAEKINAPGALNILLAIIEVAVLGSILILGAAFVLLAGAFFFITRLAVLWLLLILAPFGFVFLVLPITRGHAQNWWKKLMEQATFAPIFMFLLVLSILIIQGTFTKLFTKVQSTSIPEFLFLMFLQAVIMFVLLLATLIVSKQMGIYGAAGAIGMASFAGKWARGYAGRTAWKQIGGAATTEGIARAGAALSRIPYAGRLLRPLMSPVTKAAGYAQAQAKKTYEDQAKPFLGLGPKELSRVMQTANPNLQRAILDKTKDKKRELMLKEMGEGAEVRLGKNMKPFDMDEDVAKATNKPTVALKIMRRDLDGKENTDEYKKEMDKWLEGLSTKELSKIDPDELTKDSVQDSILRTSTVSRFNAILRNRKQRDAMVIAINQIITRRLGTRITPTTEAEVLKQIIGGPNYKNPELAEIKSNIITNLITNTAKVRGESGEAITPPPPPEEAEGGTTA